MKLSNDKSTTKHTNIIQYTSSVFSCNRAYCDGSWRLSIPTKLCTGRAFQLLSGCVWGDQVDYNILSRASESRISQSCESSSLIPAVDISIIGHKKKAVSRNLSHPLVVNEAGIGTGSGYDHAGSEESGVLMEFVIVYLPGGWVELVWH